MTATYNVTWTSICAVDLLQPERGVAALIDHDQLALFRTYDGHIFALSNVDPFSGASVLSRGIVGDRDGEPTVASPLYKQVFSLVTGQCLDDREVSVRTYPVRVVGGVVQVGLP